MDTAFFVASKVIWGLLRADSWIVIGLGLTLLGLLTGRLRLARGAAGLTFAFVVTLAILPLGELLLRPLEARYPANPSLGRVDGIVVLGGGEETARSLLWDQVELNEGAERFTAAMALARAHPEARVIFTGGSGSLRDLGREMAGADVAEAFFAAQGLAPERLVLERASRNTAENARLSLALAAPQGGETWVLVTSAFHMPRAMGSFAAAGWPDLVAFPVDHRTEGFGRAAGWNLTANLMVLNTALREFVGRLAYGATGR